MLKKITVMMVTLIMVMDEMINEKLKINGDEKMGAQLLQVFEKNEKLSSV